MKNKIVLTLTIICLFFLLMGTAFASDVGTVENTDNTNLTDNDVNLLSTDIGVSSSSVSEVNVYENNQHSVELSLSGEQTHINSSNIEMFYRDGTNFTIVLLDGNNTPLAGKNVTFSINGGNYTFTTNNKGIASLSIGLSSKNYNIVTYFLGDETYLPCNVTNTITVKPTIVGQDIVKIYRNGTNYEVTCTDKQGNLLVDSPVVFNINGVFYDANTNNEGIATLKIGLYPNDYIITAYNVATDEATSNNIKVISSIDGDDLVLYYNNGSSYEATFYNLDGSYLTNTYVQMNINGVLYDVKTNNKGVASLPIGLRPNVYIITSINPVTNQYYSNIINVLTVIESSDLVKYYCNGSHFTVKILDGQGKPLSNALVTFNINGVFYEEISDSEGLATLLIRLMPNNYIITTEFNGLTTSNLITVLTAETNLYVPEQFVFAYEPGEFNAILTYANGEPIQDRILTFTVNGISYDYATNSEGIATLPVNLNPGDYLVTVSFNEDYFEPAEESNVLHEVDSLVLILADDMTMTAGDGSNLTATLVSINDLTPIPNDIITFTVNGVSYDRITNANGVASLPIRLDPGVYLVELSHSGYKEEFSRIVTLTVNKQEAIVKSEDLYMMHNEGKIYNASFYSSEGVPLKGYSVTLTINGVDYPLITDENGTVFLPIGLNTGNYTLDYHLENYYYTATGSNIVFVNGTKFIAEDISLEAGSNGTFPVQIVDPDNNPVSNVLVTFSINQGTDVQFAFTNSEGVASAQLNGYEPGVYDIVFTYVDFNGETITGLNHFTVKSPITVLDVISASVDIKNYIESHYELPGMVTVGDEIMNIASYYYLACESLVAMSNEYFGPITFKIIDEPNEPGPAIYMGNLYTYVEVAQACLDYMDQYGIAPDYMASDIGDIGYDGLIYAMCRAVAFYDTYGVMPAYTVVKSFGSPVVPDTLNQINTIDDLTPYLVATKNCQVDNPAIQALAEQLTSGKTSDYDKAVAIYNYVRDSVSYSFYYNSHKGATGTLSAKSGNCCDQAHLVVALARAAGLPARYNHGSCTFTSGSTYGHVWPQILVGNIWVVSDPTSTRNSFGVVNNWNNYNYKLIAQYASLPF